MSNKYEAVVGLEIHIQLNTKRKAFCNCSTNYNDSANSNICPVCTGQPGALPVLNREVVKKAVMLSKAINGEINLESTFDRKNYFYPDMPKNYQITQFFKPVSENGHILVKSDDDSLRQIGIERVHIEEDTGKSLHMEKNTYLNYNRAGIPLIEIVSKPEMRSGKEAADYFRKIYLIAVNYLGICTGNMEEGNLRCDANVSIRPVGSKELFTKTEVKNVNSFSFIQKAIEHEIERQIEIVESGGMVEAETRLWNAKSGKTELMRKKHGRNDYRYFNEPDLGPLCITDSFVNEIRTLIPELPDEKYIRLKENYDLNDEILSLFIGYPVVADYYEKAVGFAPELAKKIGAWMSSELLRLEDKEHIEKAVIAPEMLAELVSMVESKKINQAQGKEIIEIMHKENRKASEIAALDPRFQAIDSGEIETFVDDAINSNPKELEAYLNGKETLFGFFVGQVMKKSKGKADPATVNNLLKEKLANRNK